MRLRCFPVTLVTCLALAGAAGAQTTSAELARRALLDQAEAARASGGHARALELATRASQIRVTPSLRLLLAQEHQALGHTLDALAQASACVREAEGDAALRNREQVLASCRALAASLARQVGHVVVRAPQGADGLVVRVAGQELVPALWGEDFPVLPGAVEVEAVDRAGARFRRSVDVRPGAREEIDVALGPAPRPATASFMAPVVAAPTTPAEVRRDDARASNGPGVAPWVMVGVGAAGVVAAVTFAVLRDGALSDRDAECDVTGHGPCRDRALAEGHDQDYRTFTTLTNVTMVVGAAGVVGGTLWLLLGRGGSDAREARSARWGVRPSGDGAVFEVAGAL